MSIVFMECSIEMHYQKERWPIERGKTYAKTSGRFCVSSENYYLPLPCRPARLTLSPPYPLRPVPSVILLSGDCRPNSDPGPRLTAAPPPLSCRLRVNFRDRASGWTDSMVAGQLRLLDSVKLDRLCPLELSPILTGRLVHATSDSESTQSSRPAWLGAPPTSRPRAACNPADGLGCH